MTNGVLPPNFNWVKERFACSLLLVFKSLEEGVRKDVETMDGLVNSKEDIIFKTHTSSNKQFSAIRIDDAVRGISRSVDFRLSEDGIRVYLSTPNGEEEFLFTANVTLDDEGHCKLRVREENLDQWQVRKRALENLFFGPRVRTTA